MRSPKKALLTPIAVATLTAALATAFITTGMAADEKYRMKCVPYPSPSWRCPHFKCIKTHGRCCAKWECLWRDPLKRDPAGL
jgi:hypothetical protein